MVRGLAGEVGRVADFLMAMKGERAAQSLAERPP